MGSEASQFLQTSFYSEKFQDVRSYVIDNSGSPWLWLAAVSSLEVLIYIFFDKVLRSLTVDHYNEKYVLITGCDSGFGQELAVRLDSLGFNVFAGCLTEDGKTNLALQCSRRVVPILLDITTNESIESALRLVKRALPQEKGLWGLVNNAGIVGNPCLSEFCTREDFLAVYNVNMFGVAEMCRHFLPLIRKAKGRIVNMCSATGRIAFVTPVDTTTKYAIEAYSDILRRELYYKGVNVSIIEAGAFRTPIFDESRVMSHAKAAYDKSPDEVKTAYDDALGKLQSMLKKQTKASSPKTYLVVDAYTHSLTSRYPRARYTVGTDGLLLIILSYLPTRLTDWLFQFV